MATMPASGSIGIISAPQTNGSICTVVGQTTGSLLALGADACKTKPVSMRNFYSYVGNNPIKLIDPSGSFWEEFSNWWNFGMWKTNAEIAEFERTSILIDQGANLIISKSFDCPNISFNTVFSYSSIA